MQQLHYPVKKGYTVGEIIAGLPCVCGGTVTMGDHYEYDDEGWDNGYDYECTNDNKVRSL